MMVQSPYNNDRSFVTGSNMDNVGTSSNFTPAADAFAFVNQDDATFPDGSWFSQCLLPCQKKDSPGCSSSNSRRPFLPHPKSFSIKNPELNPNNGKDEEALVRELNELSFKERNMALEELHGVAALPSQEKPEVLAELRKELLKELERVPKLKRRVWDRAVWLRPSLQTDEKMFNMFLRADRYDPFYAARRICKYFHYKLDLFGEDCLVRDITLDDLSPDDIEAMEIESFQVNEKTDMAGRFMNTINLTRLNGKHWTNTCRNVWYRLMVAITENELATIHGFIDIYFCQFDRDRTDWRFMENITGIGDILLASLPLWNPGCHFVYDNALLHPAMKLVQLVNSRSKRVRTRCHYGSAQEVKYSIMQFGIPEDLVRAPDEEDNRAYIEKRREKERNKENRVVALDSKGNPGIVLYPGQKDVLLGRGACYQSYPGNLILAEIIDDLRDEYLRADIERLEKTQISQEVVHRIRDRGGLFFKRTDDGWETVDDMTAREKVAHLFRAKPRPKTRTKHLLGRKSGDSSDDAVL